MHASVRLLACCACLFLFAGSVQGQGLGVARESAVKAAFLFKFGSFVEWPAGTLRSGEPLVIGVFGDDAVAAELEQITRARTVEGHPVAVVRVRELTEANGLHMLFAGGTREQRAREMVNGVRGPVLTVGDGPLGGEPGPVLFFTQDAGRVRFAASLPAAAARNLRLSARLLAVAQQVGTR